MYNSIKHLIKTVTALSIALLGISCSEDNIGATYSGHDGFAFGSTVINTEVGAEDNNKILIPVYRTSLDINTAELTFDIDASGEFKDGSDIFSLLTPNVIFADESYIAYAQIRISSLDKLDLEGKYRLILTIKDNLTPSGRDKVSVTVNRKLTFDYLGKCDYFDHCIFEKSYKADVYRARELEVYRIMDPYSEGLAAEEYAANSWVGKIQEYIQFTCDKNGNITFDPFSTGMLVNGLYLAYAYYPSAYQWGQDFSRFDKENKKISDKEIQLYAVYCLPDMRYGYLNEGAYPISITLP